MNTRPKTYVAIILDRSGSMSGIRPQTIQNYNEQIQQMQENSKEQDIFCSVISFNGSVFEHKWNVPVSELSEADMNDYVPRGSTNLFDAVGYTIDKLKETVSVDGDTAFFIKIISDGENTDTGKYSQEDVRLLIEETQATKIWTYSFLGCSQAFLEKLSRETSIPLSNMAAWSSADAASASFGYTSSNSHDYSYMKSRTRGMTAMENLYSGDLAKCADFTLPTGGTAGVDPNSVQNISAVPAYAAVVKNQRSPMAMLGANKMGWTDQPESNLTPVNICRKGKIGKTPVDTPKD